MTSSRKPRQKPNRAKFTAAQRHIFENFKCKPQERQDEDGRAISLIIKTEPEAVKLHKELLRATYEKELRKIEKYYDYGFDDA